MASITQSTRQPAGILDPILAKFYGFWRHILMYKYPNVFYAKNLHPVVKETRYKLSERSKLLFFFCCAVAAIFPRQN